jgi:hypothetical protein
MATPSGSNAERADRLRRIEDLVQALVDQHPTRGPEIVQDVPAASFEPAASIEQEGSVSDSESLGSLGSLLARLTRDGPLMPIPVTARAGQTMVQELDEILSSAHQIPAVDIDQPPNVDPFVYRPVERGRRAWSESPGSINLPPRPPTVPFYVREHPVRRPDSRREETSESRTMSLDLPPQAPVSTQTEALQEPQTVQPPVQPIGRRFPPSEPVIVSQHSTY